MAFNTTDVKLVTRISNIKLAVSIFLDNKLAKLASMIGTEFGFYMSTYDIKQIDGTIYLVIPDQDIIIPRQQASYGEVEFLESLHLPINGHKHPNSVTDFSSTDLDNITNNADISLLVTDKGVIKATYRVITNVKPLGDIMIISVIDDIIRMFDTPYNLDIHAKADEIRSKIEDKYKYSTIELEYASDWYDDILKHDKKHKRRLL